MCEVSMNVPESGAVAPAICTCLTEGICGVVNHTCNPFLHALFSHSLLERQRGNSSVGRAQPCQGWGREFESRFPLRYQTPFTFCVMGVSLFGKIWGRTPHAETGFGNIWQELRQVIVCCAELLVSSPADSSHARNSPDRTLTPSVLSLSPRSHNACITL